jgi:hypothetical protein
MIITADGGCGLMFPLVKTDLRAYTRLLSVAAAARSSPLMLLAAGRCCWIWMLMEPDRTLILHGACERTDKVAHCCCVAPRNQVWQCLLAVTNRLDGNIRRASHQSPEKVFAM